MANLKDTTITGSLQVTNTAIIKKSKIENFLLHTASNNNEYSLGGTDYFIKSGGTSEDSNTAYWAQLSTDDLKSGILPYNRGGTGINTYNEGDLLYGLSNHTLTKLSIGNQGQLLKVSNGQPTWSNTIDAQITFSNSTNSISSSSGAVIISNGGLGVNKDIWAQEINLEKYASGGEVHLNAPTVQTAEAGISLKQDNSTLKILGIISKDNTTKTTTGTTLTISPYEKTISGDYNINVTNGYFSSTLGVGGTSNSYTLYVNGTSYLNGGTSINGSLGVTGTVRAINAGETYVEAQNSTTGARILLDSSSSYHGLWSNGYWNGSSLTSSGIWILYRNTDGNLVMPRLTSLSNASGVYNVSAPMFMFLRGEQYKTDNKIGAIFANTQAVNSKNVCLQMYFRHYSYNSSTGDPIEYWDQYRLPVATADKTGDNTYDILTTKNTITVAQGGTGATTAADALTNLGAVAKAGDTMTGLLTSTRANHTSDIGFITKNTDTTNPLSIGYIIGTSGNGGIYDFTHSIWKVQIAPDGTTTFRGSLVGNADTTTKLAHTTLNSTTINNTAGSFAFSGSGDPWSGSDWVGLQIGDNADKFQISANGNTLVFRQNDNGGTNTSWSNWVTMLTSANYSSYALPLTGGTITGNLIATGYVQAQNTLYVDTGNLQMKYNNTWYSVIVNYNNGNTGINAAGGGVYIAYNNSTLVNLLNGKYQFANTTMSQDATANLNGTTVAGRMSFYTNGISIPNPGTVNDGGILRVRGSGESDTILELGTWDDSGTGETIQFNYYPSTSRVTPTYSIGVPKASGTICLTNGTGASGSWDISVTGNAATATKSQNHSFKVGTAGLWPCIEFYSDTLDNSSYYIPTANTWSLVYATIPGKNKSNNSWYGSNMFFRIYSHNGAGTRVNYYEDFYLPSCAANRTSNAGYNILTTKDLSFSITGNAATATMPLGFNSRSTGAAWGNTIGTSFTSWNDSTGGSIDFRQDNPSSGKMSIKVDGRVYVSEGNYACLSSEQANNYWGICTPDGANNVWIRTTSAGIIPYQSGGAGSGHCGLGTTSWRFSTAYVDSYYGGWKGDAIAVANGGTGATTAANARTNLSVPEIAKANANSDQIGYFRFKSLPWTSPKAQNNSGDDHTYLLLMYTGRDTSHSSRKLQLYDESTSKSIWVI